MVARRQLSLVVACIGIMVIAMIPMRSAHAASSFDEVIRTTSKLDFRDQDTQERVDVSQNWYNEIEEGLRIRCEDRSQTQFCDDYTAFQNLTNGYWMVTDMSDETGDPNSVYQIKVAWTEDTADITCSWIDGTNPRYRCSAPTKKIHMLRYIGSQTGLSQYETDSGLGVWGEMGSYVLVELIDYDTNMQGIGSYHQALFLSTFPVTYPPGYEGVVIPDTYTPPLKTYVAMGDSFSSGEGNPPFEPGTDEDTNKCHRSPKAYPRLLQNDASLNLAPAIFVACSGATTSDVMQYDEVDNPKGRWNESLPLGVLSPDVDIVTITIGGNNIGFDNYATECVLGTCNTSSAEYQEAQAIMTNSSRADYLPDSLTEVYSEIAAGVGDNTKVLVVGYPYMVTHDGYITNSYTPTVPPIGNLLPPQPSDCMYLNLEEASATEQLISTLNSTIESAVVSMNDARFTFVATEPGPAEDELCSPTSHYNGPVLINDTYSFHPIEEGQVDYMNIIKNFMQ